VLKRTFRSVLAVLVGLILISTVVEAIEFGLVTLINGKPTTDPVTYYAIRNRPWFLMLKLLYNTLAAVGAGYLVARIAGYAGLRHAVALAFVQTVAFVWALTQPQMRQWAPDWMWVSLIVLTIAGLVAGARWRLARAAARRAIA
jgi:hypothetical protein